MSGLATRLPLPRGLSIVMAIIVAVLLWQVALPIGGLLLSSFKTSRPIDPGFLTDPLTFANFQTILDNGGLWRVTATTLVFALSSSLLALLFGTYLAWVTTRTDLRLTWLLSTLVLVQLAVPDFMFATSWTFLFGPEIGFFNHLWRQATGSSDALVSIYSIPGMIVVEAFLLMPLVYLFAVPALSALDGTLEDAAAMAGASRMRASIDIALPLIAPALLAIFVITVMRAWEAFDVPWVLGLRNGDMKN